MWSFEKIELPPSMVLWRGTPVEQAYLAMLEKEAKAAKPKK